MWQINFVSWQRLIAESRISSLTAKSQALEVYGVGENIKGLISTALISTVLFLAKGIKTIRFLMFRY
jgi:hypothetical protein